MLCAFALGVTASLACAAHAAVQVNEVVGSTAGDDAEFIELHNTGSKEVDLTGWTIDLWDSDAGAVLGTPDGDSPIRLRGRIDAGGYFLLANSVFSKYYEIEPDQRFRDNGIENSSYTIVLKDNLGVIVETIFVTDGGEGDKANVGGREITPDATIRAEGRFIPPGFARVPRDDGEREYRLLKFSPVPTPGATPGKPNLFKDEPFDEKDAESPHEAPPDPD
ncbi:MAG: lamin tail domain-containing protein [Phycisphaeraceae bacterium]|nr:MAG: lamin tail domain-containing protein [Phycisphaeraceae bacterium]